MKGKALATTLLVAISLSVAARAQTAAKEALVEEHLWLTGSARAAALLADWAGALARFRQVVPAVWSPAPGSVGAESQDEADDIPTTKTSKTA